MRQYFIPISKFAKEPYSGILGYPKATKRQLESRIKELRKLKVSGIMLRGKTTIGKLEILGKGYVGVVVLARKGRLQYALKIRRIDSQRDDLREEARLLKMANLVDVGPQLYAVSKNFILMEYLDGEKIGDWIKNLEGKNRAARLKKVTRDVLESCYRLDQAGFDHGELSSIAKHVIIAKSKTTLIDFESSSTNRRAANVTSATQAIYIGSGIAKTVHRTYKTPSKQEIIEKLRQYKTEPSRKSFDELLDTLKL